eukprot:scaffold303_cov49-Cyclotella_meneghiniana.AAC.3
MIPDTRYPRSDRIPDYLPYPISLVPDVKISHLVSAPYPSTYPRSQTTREANPALAMQATYHCEG